MFKKIAATMAALAMVMGLAACNTVKGVGKDVERAGEGVQNADRRPVARAGPAGARPALLSPSRVAARQHPRRFP